MIGAQRRSGTPTQGHETGQRSWSNGSIKALLRIHSPWLPQTQSQLCEIFPEALTSSLVNPERLESGWLKAERQQKAWESRELAGRHVEMGAHKVQARDRGPWKQKGRGKGGGGVSALAAGAASGDRAAQGVPSLPTGRCRCGVAFSKRKSHLFWGQDGIQTWVRPTSLLTVRAQQAGSSRGSN